jgi:hypothetical protein
MEKRSLNIDKLGEILQQSLKRLDVSAQLNEYGVWPIWNETVGSTIARNAQPEKIRNGTLFVKVTSPVWMQQLQYMKGMIAEKINERLGNPVVKNIFFLVGTVETPASATKTPLRATPPIQESKLDEKDLDSIKDPELREALRRLLIASRRDAKNSD